MSLLPKVGRKNTKVRLGILLIYTLVVLGGVTMVYPFLITVTGAVSNSLDISQYRPYPRYLFNKQERYMKFLAEKYYRRFAFFKSAYQVPEYWGEFNDMLNSAEAARCISLLGIEKDPQAWERLMIISADYEEFLNKHYNTRKKAEFLVPLFIRYEVDNYRQFLKQRYFNYYLRDVGEQSDAVVADEEIEPLALKKMVELRGDYFETFDDVGLEMFLNYGYDLSAWIPTVTGRHVDYVDWILSLPSEKKEPVTRQHLWTRYLARQGVSAEKYNKEMGVSGTDDAIASIYELKYPVGDCSGYLQELKESFISSGWPIRWRRIVVTDAMIKEFREFLAEQYLTEKMFNDISGMDISSWRDIVLTGEIPSIEDGIASDKVVSDYLNVMGTAWRNYMKSIPNSENQMICPEAEYQKFLLQKYGSNAEINSVYGWHNKSVEDILLPVKESDYVYYYNNRKMFFKKFLTFNYSEVFKFMATRGRALWNTFVLIVLTILATLTVNPLAAYALSRFKLRNSNQILIFMLATMAFPAEVAMIPNFLLLRDLNLLNTFGALILPTLANGYSIFLLKGFFDSLPKELYEAASIDGATEFKMFVSITLPLCKPILAVIALNAFLAAYGGFMWAFLVCQDSKMWTLMVWLYNFQERMSDQPSMVMAALMLSSIPTLLVFLFCQKIILRGIIIPSMK